MSQPKLIVIGLDGASWRLLDPWIEEGKLPNLEKMIEKGVHGKLRSVIPATTCPAWKCYSTGKRPANLGAFGWSRINWEEETFDTLRFSFSDETEIWDYLNREGFTTGVMNTPITYPPKQVDGFMITGPSTPSEDKEYTYPKGLKDRLKNEYDYRIFPKLTSWVEEILEEEDIFQHVKENIKTKFKVARDLGKDVDFLQFTIYRTDPMQHGLWNGEIVEKLWKLIDEEIGKIMDEYPDSNILIMSDHGMEKISTYFNIGGWLEENGYCSKKEVKEETELTEQLGLKRKNLFDLIENLNLGWLVRLALKTMPFKVAKEAAKMVRGGTSSQDLNWEESKVIPSGNLIYLKPSIENRENLKKSLRDEISKISKPETGARIIRKVYEKEEIFQGEYSKIAPDLAVIPNDDVYIMNLIGKKTWGDVPNNRWIADHIMHGILIGSGPDFKEDMKVENARLIDLAPTLLHAFGISAKRSMNGEPLKEIYKNGKKPEKSSLKREDKTTKEKKEIKRKIRNLKNREEFKP